jgi:hypothetical protein
MPIRVVVLISQFGWMKMPEMPDGVEDPEQLSAGTDSCFDLAFGPALSDFIWTTMIMIDV